MTAESLISYLLFNGFKFCGTKRKRACFASELSTANFYLGSLDVHIEDKKSHGQKIFECGYWCLKLHDNKLYYVTGDPFNIQEMKVEM